MNFMITFNRLRKHRIYGHMITFLIVYVLFLLVMFQMQRSMTYFPGKTHQRPVDIGANDMEVISVQPAGMDSGIEGWYQAPADQTKPVIVYYHGNAMTVPGVYPRVEAFLKAGYGVLLAEYRGYNKNPGKPTEKGLYADADAYTKWLMTTSGIPENRIVFYGLSLGTGVAVNQVVKNPGAAGMILEAPFTSLVDVAQRHYFYLPVRLLMLDRYPSKKHIAAATVPLLVLHGERDAVVPVSQGKALYALAGPPKTLKLYPEGGHDDLPAHGSIQDTLDFLNKLSY